jgi:5-methyltetrahydropteroyltriglutamate--homocysteine methyltransferase
VDKAAVDERIHEAVKDMVARQIKAGVDVVNDGEMPRPSYATYVKDRLNGFGGTGNTFVFQDIEDFPQTKARVFADPGRKHRKTPACNAPITVKDMEAPRRDAQRLMQAVKASGGTQAFTSAASPGVTAFFFRDDYYGSHEKYVFAIADAMRHEYEAIVSAGPMLQIDCPDLAMERHTSFTDRPLEEFLDYVDLNISAINHSLENLPADKVRMHVCWGNYEGPHDSDVPLDDILPNLYAAKVGALVLSMANPRHGHEHKCLKRRPLPEGWLLVAGVIDTTTNYVEHPEVVADRIEHAAEAVGDPHRVLAGTDCGFDTAAGLGEVAEEVVWLKLAALRAGADLAARRLL